MEASSWLQPRICSNEEFYNSEWFWSGRTHLMPHWSPLQTALSKMKCYWRALQQTAPRRQGGSDTTHSCLQCGCTFFIFTSHSPCLHVLFSTAWILPSKSHCFLIVVSIYSLQLWISNEILNLTSSHNPNLALHFIMCHSTATIPFVKGHSFHAYLD